MTRWIAVMLISNRFRQRKNVYAQESAAGSGHSRRHGRFRAGRHSSPRASRPTDRASSNYGLGGGVEVNFNRYVGVEGEVTGGAWDHAGPDFTERHVEPEDAEPAQLQQQRGRSAANRLDRAIRDRRHRRVDAFRQRHARRYHTDTFLTGNVGGGVKWFNSSGRWGLRGDYRFVTVKSRRCRAELLRTRDAIRPPCLWRPADQRRSLRSTC